MNTCSQELKDLTGTGPVVHPEMSSQTEALVGSLCVGASVGTAAIVL